MTHSAHPLSCRSAGRAEALAAEHDPVVLATNIPFATEDCEIVRHEATASTVLGLYLDQYKVEYTYRLMKSAMGVDSVYVRTPQRSDALLSVVAVATLISGIIDALLRRNGSSSFPTVKKAAKAILHVMFKFHCARARSRSPNPKDPRTVSSPTPTGSVWTHRYCWTDYKIGWNRGWFIESSR